jgi:hypothetical protein
MVLTIKTCEKYRNNIKKIRGEGSVVIKINGKQIRKKAIIIREKKLGRP